MQDNHPMIAEVHQADISQPMFVIIHDTPKVERMVGMMKKNLPAFLWHMLLEQGLPEQFITDLIKNFCEAYMISKQNTCTWNAATRTLTTTNEAVKEAETKSFEGTAWFRDEFGLLEGGAHRNEKRPLPETFFNLDGASVNAIYDRHQALTAPPGMPPKESTKPKKNKKSAIINMTNNSDKDSASSKDLSSNGNLAPVTKGCTLKPLAMMRMARA
jgi:hypothetical protein